MDQNELIKLAYAYGASIALQETGMGQAEAEAAGLKLAEKGDFGEDPSVAQRILASLPLVGGAGAGLSAPEGAGWGRSYRSTLGGTLGAGIGGGIGAGAGAGIGKLLGNKALGALIGGGAGLVGGGALGSNLALNRSAKREKALKERILAGNAK